MTEFILKRAQCADALGNYEKAIQDYQTVLKDPHVPPDLIMDVNYYFACALYNYGEIERAKHILENLEKDHAEGNDCFCSALKANSQQFITFNVITERPVKHLNNPSICVKRWLGKGESFIFRLENPVCFGLWNCLNPT